MEYIIAIAQEKGITRAANKLFITQSALNQQLIKLERELGVQLFHRSRNSCTPTNAGEIYVEYARNIVNLKHEAYQKIYDIAEHHRGSLSVAFSPERGMEMFMEVYPAFYQIFPQVTVVSREIGVQRQMQMLRKNEMDLGFLSMADQEVPGIVCKPMMTEEFVLITPLDHPLAQQAAPNGERFTQLPCTCLKNLTMCLMYRESTQRAVIDPLFSRGNTQPNIFLETASNRANLSMVERGLACSILPSFYVKNLNTVAVFRLEGEPSWVISACYRQGAYVSRGMQQFIALAAEYFQREQGF